MIGVLVQLIPLTAGLVRDEVEPPQLRAAPAIVRPSGTGNEEVEVVLLLVIDTQGRVTQARVLESAGALLDEAAVRAARAFVFKPARDGQPIEVEVEYAYVFPELKPPLDNEQNELDEVELVQAPQAPTETTLTGEDGQAVAGIQGDAIKAAASLGGVGRPALGTGELVLWGAAPADTRRQVDWIMVPRLFHLGGGRSVLPSVRVQSVRVTPGAYGPAFGRSLGGLIVVHTDTPESSVGGFARLDPIDVGAGLRTTATARGSIAVSARRSVLNQTYGAVAPEATRAVVPLPDSWDWQLKSHAQLHDNVTLELLGFGAEDRLERALPARRQTAFSERVRDGFHRGGARLRRQGAGGARSELAAWVGRDSTSTRQSFEAVDVRAQHYAWLGGLRVEQHRTLGPHVELLAGLDGELSRSRWQQAGALTLPAREGDIVVYGQPPGDRVAEDAWRVTHASLAGYIVTPLRWRAWRFEPGLRVEPTLHAGDRILPVRPVEPEVGYADLEIAWLPRATLRWDATGTLELFAAGGRYAQQASAQDRSSVFGNPKLPLAYAEQAAIGTTLRPRMLTIGMTGFWRRSQRRAGRAASPTPPTAELLAADQDGRSFGGQLLVRVEPHPTVQATLLYAWTSAQRRDVGNKWRRSDFDQPHLAQALASWRHTSGVSLSGRATLTSGMPRTNVARAEFSAAFAQWDPVFGAHNELRLPTFFELAIQVAYQYDAAWGSLRAWLDVQNATNRANGFEYFYSADYSRRGTIRGLPVLPMLGLQVRT